MVILDQHIDCVLSTFDLHGPLLHNVREKTFLLVYIIYATNNKKVPFSKRTFKGKFDLFKSVFKNFISSVYVNFIKNKKNYRKLNQKKI